MYLDSYALAREKAKKAEYTSDLSTTPTKHEYNNTKPTLKTKKKDKCRQKENSVLWNPSSSDCIGWLIYIIANLFMRII